MFLFLVQSENITCNEVFHVSRGFTINIYKSVTLLFDIPMYSYNGCKRRFEGFFFSSLYSYNKDKSDLKFGSSHVGEQTILLNYKSLQFTYISGKTFHK